MNTSPKLTALIAGCLVGIGCAAQAKPSDGVAATNIFSPPVTDNTVPTFTGRENSAKSIDALIGSHGELPDVNEFKSIPSLNDDQRKRLDDLYRQTNNVTQPLREETSALERILHENKTSKTGMFTAGDMAPPSPPNLLHRDFGQSFDNPATIASAYGDGSIDSINGRIQAIKQQIADEHAQLWDRIMTVVRPDQMNELLSMRHGRLLIVSQSNTDVPDPTPKSAPKPPQQQPKPQQAKPSQPNNFMANRGRPIFPAPPPVKTILLNTTRSLLYRALWSVH